VIHRNALGKRRAYMLKSLTGEQRFILFMAGWDPYYPERQAL
jgi:hypothetical protein